MLVGGEDLVEERLAVPAPAARHQHVRVARRGRRIGGGLGEVSGGDLPPQIAGVHHLLRRPGRQRDAGERIADRGEPVHPDAVVVVAQGGGRALAGPFVREAGGLVQHVAQPEDEPGVALPEEVEGSAHLSPEPERLLVHDEHVGAKCLRGVADDGLAERQHLVEGEVEGERGVLPVRELGDPGNAHEIDPRRKLEAADEGRPGDDEHREVPARAHERAGDRPAPAQVPEAERVVAVDEDPGRAARHVADSR